MKIILIKTFFLGSGIIMFLSSVFNWEIMYSSRKFKRFAASIGDEKAKKLYRFFCGFMGILLTAIGVMMFLFKEWDLIIGG